MINFSFLNILFFKRKNKNYEILKDQLKKLEQANTTATN
jgi:hypothetical protein